MIIISIKIDLTTIANEQTENENWSKTTTVSLTSNNLHTLTTQNVHISSLVMRTKQQYEHISLNTQSQSMKPYPSSNTIVNEQSTISTTIETTVSNQQTTFLPSSHQTTTMMMTPNKLITTVMQSQDDDIQTTSSDNPISITDSTFTSSKRFSFVNFVNFFLLFL